MHTPRGACVHDQAWQVTQEAHVAEPEGPLSSARPVTEPGHLPAGHVSDYSNTCSSVRRPTDIVKPHMPAIHSPHPQRTTTAFDRTPSPSK